MKPERNILIAFLLNLTFSVLEAVGGVLTGSVAILSDAVHDLGDAVSIGLSYALERKSRQRPDERATYGYVRYSLLGSIVTTLILLLGSVAVIGQAVSRMIFPAEIHEGGMMAFALLGVFVNGAAALFTRDGSSLNQRAVNLHMLEDVLGWAVVLLGAIVIRFTGFTLLDPILSLGVAVFILVHAVGNLKETLEVFLEKTPRGVDVEKLRRQLCGIDGVQAIHHLHVWSLDGQRHCATLHIVTEAETCRIKGEAREILRDAGIRHATLELETAGERCGERECHLWEPAEKPHAHHHHHQHHHH